MAKNILIPVVLTIVLTSSVGCSGSRLRNMVGRSDYSSIEELEEADAYAEYEGYKRKDVLAAQERELTEEDPATIQKQRKGFFDFVKVFNRKSDEDEFAPDPFTEPAVTDESKEVRTVSAGKSSEFENESAVADKAEKFNSTIADVEKQAEALFTEGVKARQAVSTKVETSAETLDGIFAEQSDTPQEQSFADFINRQKQAAGPVVADVEKAADKAVESVVRTVSQAKETGSKFDSFLNQSTEGEQKTASTDESSDLFPGLSEAFDEAFEDPSLNEPYEQEPVATASLANPFAESVDAPFAETTSKHGFKTSGGKDPWAAFNESARKPAAAAPVEVVSSTHAEQRNEFNWSQPSGSRSSQTQSAFPAMDGQGFQGHGEEVNHDQAFLQVSSTSTLDTQRPVDMSESMPLVIPGGMAADSTFDNSAFQSEVQPAPVGSDPFLTSVPVFEDVAPESATDVDVTAATSVATASEGLGQWSRRTWFFLIGCLIVAFLLFMPDRHNRTNA